ncbi:Cytochrome c oxidase subunit 7C, mitochondrial [Fukomys damarensis]|uniref:Cytochrome c oxidase subunit 7C, mitochondrial n=1 Tax=Fukomys damarensis TaxID=885580 RepID=A0A091DBD8_FUKDA|nr:Cytochrome c oxidase subunit 7C, mitochondrial [Fukomys damarensis]
MLGQSIRRFTTSVVRRSHYEEGPGKVRVRGWVSSAGRESWGPRLELPRPLPCTSARSEPQDRGDPRRAPRLQVLWPETELQDGAQ